MTSNRVPSADAPGAAGSPARPNIPEYDLLEKIGEGGMGEVYRATHRKLQRTVGVKFLKPSGDGDHPALAFQRESQLMASLLHPNIVTIYDCGQIDGRHYLVMEYVPGPNLRALMKPGQPWPIARAAPLLDAIARALSYIHDQGILHLDLKPENVLLAGIMGQESGVRSQESGVRPEMDGSRYQLTPDSCLLTPVPKLTDFGLALSRLDERARAESEWAGGTIDYCAPEQRYGLPIDQRSDLFALATLAYELLTGQLPGRVYVPALQRNPRLPAAVDAVLRRGLARKPGQRQASVEEFRRELVRALQERRPRYGVRAALAAAGLALLVAVPLLAHRLGGAGKSENGSPEAPAVPPSRAWILYDQEETLAWLGGEGKDELAGGPGVTVQRWRVTGNPSEHLPDLQLPAWPEPLPVLVLSDSKAWGFVHPFQDPALGQQLLRQWPSLSSRASPVNWIRAGTFDGDCLGHKANPWLLPKISQDWREGDQVTIGIPADQPGNPALLLVKKDVKNTTRPVMCTQSVPRPQKRPGPFLVLRCRARAEEDQGRLSIGLNQVLFLPKEDQGPSAARLRRLGTPLAPLPDKPEMERVIYRVNDWVTPTAQWQTYWVIWECPPFGPTSSPNSLTIAYAGLGKVWVDDVEMFTWEPPNTP